MKVIDEKGRLFGKINVVDLLALVVLVLVVAVLAVKFLGGDTEEEKTGATLVYTVRFGQVTQETYDNLCQFVDKEAGVKDQLMTSNGMVDGAYVVDIWSTEHITTPTDTLGGDTLDVYFTIEAAVEDAQYNLVGSQEVRIGKTHTVKTAHMELAYGMITSCNWTY